MFGKKKTEVLIVGAGPVGLFAANKLAGAGRDVLVVDREWRTTQRSYACALHPRTLELLDEMGLASGLVETGHRIEAVGFYDGSERRAELRYDRLDSPFPFLLVLPQNVLEKVLEDSLEQKGVEIDWNHRVASLEQDDTGVVTTVDKLGKDSAGYGVATTEWVVDRTLRVSSQFVLGADGHRSIVRRDAGIQYEDLGGTLLMGVFEFQTADMNRGELRLVLDDETTNVLWPLASDRARWSFQLATAEEAVRERLKSRLLYDFGGEMYPVFRHDRLGELIEQRAPWFEGPIGDVEWSLTLRFERRLADRYGSGRVWLAGDSAHLTSPAGIQSMNIGFLEAGELAETMLAGVEGQDVASRLAGYESQWLGVWRRLLGLEGPPQIDETASEWVRSRAQRIPPCVPASGAHLNELLNQIGLRLSEEEQSVSA